MFGKNCSEDPHLSQTIKAEPRVPLRSSPFHYLHLCCAAATRLTRTTRGQAIMKRNAILRL